MSTLTDHLVSIRKIVAGINPDRGFHATLKSILDVMQADDVCMRPHILIFDPEARNLRLFLPEDSAKDAQTIDTPGAGITGQVFSSGKAVIVEKILGNPVFICKFFKRTREEMERLSFISVPILSEDNQCLGALSMDTPITPMPELRCRCEYLEAVAGVIALLAAYAERDAHRQKNTISSKSASPMDRAFVATSKPMQTVLEAAARAGVTNNPVLIIGEKGTGKYLLATTIHATGPRSDLALHTFDRRCPANEADRILFGYKKGAFPGADNTNKGLLELAMSSTLFISDIDQLPLTTQEKLAQALTEQKFDRIGGQSVDMDVRLICASTADLGELVRNGLFSARLYELIRPFQITLPSLRERQDDIIPLALEILKQTVNAEGRQIAYLSAQAQNALLRYPWPGNVRELRTVLEQAAKSCQGDTLHQGNLPADIGASPQLSTNGESFSETVERYERELLVEALRAANGNMLQTARNLKTSYRIINYKIKKYGIEPKTGVDRS